MALWKPIPAGSRWDLGHVTLEGRAQGLPARHREHIGCNRAEPFRRLHRQANAKPEPKVRFDGLPDPTPDRWGRHWGPPEFNPRCRDCRERRSACDHALKWARVFAKRAERAERDLGRAA